MFVFWHFLTNKLILDSFCHVSVAVVRLETLNPALQKAELISSNGKVIKQAKTAEVVLEPPSLPSDK